MTNIEWTHIPGYAGATWNPIIGCRHVAEGCRNCYAETMSKRLAAMGQADYASILTPDGRFNGKAITRPEFLDVPLRKKKPTCYFVNSMSDLFHDDVPFEFIAAVYGVMAACPQHLFIILTKRPKRMRLFFEWLHRHTQDCLARGFDVTAMGEAGKCVLEARIAGDITYARMEPALAQVMGAHGNRFPWPLPNVIHGYSAANQADLDAGVGDLLATPSALRCLSLEPLIGPVDLRPWLECRCDKNGNCDVCLTGGIDWVLVGGESGPGARPCDVAWIRSIVDQCKSAGTACFVKQCGAHPFERHLGGTDVPLTRQPVPLNLRDRKGGDPSEWPSDIRVREWPEVARG